jgi:hypothetical protein
MEANPCQHTEYFRPDPDGWRSDRKITAEQVPSDVFTVDDNGDHPQKEGRESGSAEESNIEQEAKE